MGEPRHAVVVHLLRGAGPSVAAQSDETLLGAAQAIVDELAEHPTLTPGDVVGEMIEGGVPHSEAIRFAAAAMTVMTPGPHGRCRVPWIEERVGRRG